jgi:hypothetical protein
MSMVRREAKKLMDSYDAVILEAHKFTPDEIKGVKERMIKLSKGVSPVDGKQVDARTMHNANAKILEHSIDVYKHCNPVLQKSELELKGLPVPPTELTYRIIESQKDRK